jgi:NAD(P)-dependent dehydrogenase (short-subunit alcohol dehydrogenase family)
MGRLDGKVALISGGISCIAGLGGSRGASAYTASKGAVRLFTKATAVQHAKDNHGAPSVSHTFP